MGGKACASSVSGDDPPIIHDGNVIDPIGVKSIKDAQTADAGLEELDVDE